MSYIDREDAIKALRQAFYEYEDKIEKRFLNSDELDIYDWIEHRIFVQNMSDIDNKTILEMPDADVEPIRHGEWIPTEKGWECSVCGQDWVSGTAYCPYCGTKMDEDTTDDVFTKPRKLNAEEIEWLLKFLDEIDE